MRTCAALPMGADVASRMSAACTAFPPGDRTAGAAPRRFLVLFLIFGAAMAAQGELRRREEGARGYGG